MKRNFLLSLLATITFGPAFSQQVPQEKSLKLPAGFSAQIFADDVGRARHIVVTPQGNLYVKLSRLEDGKGIILLQDLDKDGKAETQTGFADFTGTGIA